MTLDVAPSPAEVRAFAIKPPQSDSSNYNAFWLQLGTLFCNKLRFKYKIMANRFMNKFLDTSSDMWSELDRQLGRYLEICRMKMTA